MKKILVLFSLIITLLIVSHNSYSLDPVSDFASSATQLHDMFTGDYDNDGVINMLDECPYLAGSDEADGCPIMNINGDFYDLIRVETKGPTMVYNDFRAPDIQVDSEPDFELNYDFRAPDIQVDSEPDFELNYDFRAPDIQVDSEPEEDRDDAEVNIEEPEVVEEIAEETVEEEGIPDSLMDEVIDILEDAGIGPDTEPDLINDLLSKIEDFLIENGVDEDKRAEIIGAIKDKIEDLVSSAETTEEEPTANDSQTTEEGDKKEPVVEANKKEPVPEVGEQDNEPSSSKQEKIKEALIEDINTILDNTQGISDETKEKIIAQIQDSLVQSGYSLEVIEEVMVEVRAEIEKRIEKPLYVSASAFEAGNNDQEMMPNVDGALAGWDDQENQQGMRAAFASCSLGAVSGQSFWSLIMLSIGMLPVILRRFLR